ncbi:MAG: tripartite tricarboxylate transporter TctB family protein [Desulfobulbia bacterium]
MGQILFPGVISILAIYYGLIAQTYPSMSLEEGFGPGLFPTGIALVVAVLAAVECYRQFSLFRLVKKRSDSAGIQQFEAHSSEIYLSELLGAGFIIVTVIVTVFAIPFIGFIPASALTIFTLSTFMGTRPIWKSAAIALVTAAIIYLVFAKGFNVIFAF